MSMRRKNGHVRTTAMRLYKHGRTRARPVHSDLSRHHGAGSNTVIGIRIELPAALVERAGRVAMMARVDNEAVWGRLIEAGLEIAERGEGLGCRRVREILEQLYE